MWPVDATDQPERAPRIEAATVEFTHDIEALLGECGLERGVPDGSQE
jgi:hypothetical protein